MNKLSILSVLSLYVCAGGSHEQAKLSDAYKRHREYCNAHQDSKVFKILDPCQRLESRFVTENDNVTIIGVKNDDDKDLLELQFKWPTAMAGLYLRSITNDVITQNGVVVRGATAIWPQGFWPRVLKVVISLTLGVIILYTFYLLFTEAFGTSELVRAYNKGYLDYVLYFLKYLVISLIMHISIVFLSIIWLHGFIGIKPKNPLNLLPGSLVSHWIGGAFPGVWMVYQIYVKQEISPQVISVVLMTSIFLIAGAVRDFLTLDLDTTMTQHHWTEIAYGSLALAYPLFGWKADPKFIASSLFSESPRSRSPLAIALGTHLLLGFSGGYDIGSFWSMFQSLNVTTALSFVYKGMFLCNILLGLLFLAESGIFISTLREVYALDFNIQSSDVRLRILYIAIMGVAIGAVVLLSKLRLEDAAKVKRYPDTVVKYIRPVVIMAGSSQDELLIDQQTDAKIKQFMQTTPLEKMSSLTYKDFVGKVDIYALIDFKNSLYEEAMLGRFMRKFAHFVDKNNKVGDCKKALTKSAKITAKYCDGPDDLGTWGERYNVPGVKNTMDARLLNGSNFDPDKPDKALVKRAEMENFVSMVVDGQGNPTAMENWIESEMPKLADEADKAAQAAQEA